MSTKWDNAVVDVDNAAIAAAVAAAVDIPTALENGTAAATAVGAQAACAAAITAASLPTAAQVATAVGAQAACAAAITAAALPAAVTGGGYGTTHALVFGDGSVTLGNVWRSCVTAIGDSTAALVLAMDVEASCLSAVDSAAVVNGSLYSLARPLVVGGPSSHTGSTSYTVLSAIAGVRYAVWMVVMSSTVSVVWSLWSGATGAIIGDQWIPAKTPICITSPVAFALLANLEDALVLKVSDSAAVISLTLKATDVGLSGP